MTRIFIVTPEVFTSEELRAYEQQILDQPNATEQEASQFFAQFPKFLSIGGYKKIAREVVLYRPDGEAVYRVDFCRCRFGAEHWDFVELKSPGAALLVKRGTHWRLSADLYAGIEQAQDYRDFLEEMANRLELEKRVQIKAFRPRLLLVGGRQNTDVNPEDLIRVTSRFANVDIQTYDDIYRFAVDNYRTAFVAIPIVQETDFPVLEDSAIRHVDWASYAQQKFTGVVPLPDGGYMTVLEGRTYWGSGTYEQRDPGEYYARSKAAEIVLKHEGTRAPDWVNRALDDAFAFVGGRGHPDDAFWQEIQSRLHMDTTDIAEAIEKRRNAGSKEHDPNKS